MMSATCYRCGKVVFESESHVANGTRWHRRCWDEAVAEARATVGAMPTDEPMTTEPRPVVPGTEELRRRLAGAAESVLVCEDEPCEEMLSADEIVDAILAEIEAAGMAIVATDRLERLVAGGSLHRQQYVDLIVTSRINRVEGDASTAEIVLWEREAEAVAAEALPYQPGDLELLAGSDR